MPVSETSFPFENLSQLRAEVICTSLQESGYAFDKLIIEFLGSFRRSYRADAEPMIVNRQEKAALTLSLHRDGIYDRLPEGLFHQPKRHGTSNGASQTRDEYLRYKEEETQARKFFKPLEQEFFRYSCAIEQAEREGLRGLQGGTKLELFSMLWDLPDGLPERTIPLLAGIMPWSRYIKGDRELSEKVMSILLAKPVKVEQHIITEQRVEETGPALNGGTLGLDIVTGSRFEEGSVTWEFKIGDLAPAEVSKFVDKNEPNGRLLQHFVHTFVPMEIDVSFAYELTEETADDGERVLGFSLTL